MCEYPSKFDLQAIRDWELNSPDDYYDLAKFILQKWHYAGSSKIRARILELNTLGWSGNEEIIDALYNHKFWITCWLEIKRGGHYKFELPIKK